jgi:hypothetical protein
MNYKWVFENYINSIVKAMAFTRKQTQQNNQTQVWNMSVILKYHIQIS